MCVDMLTLPPMGHSVRVLREEEKGTISWKIKFRNGTGKKLYFSNYY